MITGTVTVALVLAEAEQDQSAADRRALGVLPQCPDGAHVEIDLGARKFVDHSVAHLLHEQDHRLQIEIRGSDPTAVARLIRAARTGLWEVGA